MFSVASLQTATEQCQQKLISALVACGSARKSASHPILPKPGTMGTPASPPMDQQENGELLLD
jgi:hypothetical protein